ncbi:ABC-three component system middle component 5 [Dongia soli]|uniref:ABC-three component system middle component 5 n=1 Tax=Dongia soli TaxID=600628 RepID=A0ABU5EEC5_9PROT|nr:ABC-three component system middle component 5 [Dongia soli]MDY0884686.1 ABC-three component system middle component 5 [Dongia soli]
MNFRLWYPQLDVYDTVRRMSCLLAAWRRDASGVERFYILDFFLSAPCLLHNTHMPSDTRQHFRSLNIERPNKGFLAYPASPILFSKMESVQKSAMQTMIGKGLIDIDAFKIGIISPSLSGKDFCLNMHHLHSTDSERNVIIFLVEHFSKIGSDGPIGLRNATGLRRGQL